MKILETALKCINEDKNLEIILHEFEKSIINQCGLLSLKPKLFVCNVDEKSIKNGNKYTEQFINKFGKENKHVRMRKFLHVKKMTGVVIF